MKNKENLVFVVAALIVGVLIGVIFSNLGGGGSTPRVPAQTSAPAPSVNTKQQIEVLLDVVAKEPENRNAWVQLGNLYFDTNQPVQAVDAYGKALELNGQDPNVLTDQGVMFRRLGWYDKAIENFRKANQLQPNHTQSLYNMGLVYLQDLKNFDKAAEAWEQFLEVNPTGPGADQVRQQLQTLRDHPPLPNQ